MILKENFLFKKNSSDLILKKFHFIYFLIVVFSILYFPSSFSQSNEDCLTCHEDNTLSTERKGKAVSLYVNVKPLQNSPHRKLTCVSCHVGFNAEDLPHKENIQPINCMSCHKDARVKHQFHPQMKKANGMNGPEGSSCKGCHGTHDVVSLKSKNSKWSTEKLTESCGQCHKNVKDVFILSKHYEGLIGGVLGSPNCLSCHKNALVTQKGVSDSLQRKIAQEKLMSYHAISMMRTFDQRLHHQQSLLLLMTLVFMPLKL